MERVGGGESAAAAAPISAHLLDDQSPLANGEKKKNFKSETPMITFPYGLLGRQSHINTHLIILLLCAIVLAVLV